MNHIKKIRDLIIYALVILSCTDISLPCHILFYCTKFPVIILCHVVFLSASLLLSLLAISRTLGGMSVPFFFLCLLTHRCYALLTGDEASLRVEKSPGVKPGTSVRCARVHIHGLSRLRNLTKFAHSVKVNVSIVDSSARLPNVEVCFHR